MVKFNSAFRLLKFFEKCKKINSATLTQEAFRQSFNINTYEYDKFYIRLGLLTRLPAEVSVDLNTYFPHLVTSQSELIKSINNAFLAIDLGKPFSTFIDKINNGTLSSLALLSELFSSRNDIFFTKINEDQINNIRKEIVAIRNEIITSKSSSLIKEELLKTLDDILFALDGYMISDISSLITQIDVVIGKASRNKEFQNELTNTSIGKKIIGVLSAITVIFSFVNSGYELYQNTDSIMQLITNKVWNNDITDVDITDVDVEKNDN